ncbi:MAG: hypothetical protein JO157_06600 [Acetobacteraceae bacterium]|nr:hypothetical protein [Acetobacteraceae bacterium]
MPPDTNIAARREPGAVDARGRPPHPPRTRPGRQSVTTHDLDRARFLLLQAASDLEAEGPTIRDDAALFLDMLEAEGGDVALLPAAFVRTKHEPDRAALLAALKAGQTIPGAVLAPGDETLTVRMTWPWIGT